MCKAGQEKHFCNVRSRVLLLLVRYRCKCRNLTKTKHNIYSYDIYILHKIYISGVSASCPVPTILYTERVLAGTPPLLAGPQSRVDTRTVNSVNTVTRKYLVTNRKYLVLHCYFDGAPAFPDKSQFLTAPAHLAAGSTYSPHSSVTDNCRHGDFRRNIFFRLHQTCKQYLIMFENVY